MGLRHRPFLALVALAALAGLTSACTSAEPGTPAATSGGAPSSSAPPQSASTLPNPIPTSGQSTASPVDLSKVKDACALFTSSVTSVAETAGPKQKTTLPRLPDAVGCFQFNESKNVGLTIAVSTHTDLDSFSTSMATEPQRFDVAGYEGVVIKPQAPQFVCFAGVGMGDHQLVYLQYAVANPGSQPQVPQDQLCAKLQPIAEQVVAQLAQ